MQSNIKYTILFFTILSLVISSCRKSDYIDTNTDIYISDNGEGVGTTTWTSDKEYNISGFTFVNDGQILTIEPGTIIHFAEGQGLQASALIVARGGKIIAEGTADKPIIFTSERDDLNGSVNVKEDGLWGGIIILGNAPMNTISNEGHIEGIPISEPRGIYGGNNENDNSGILKYVSIRHSGSFLGQANEINGLTLGGVGSGTILEYIEVIASADDGIECFGGTVNLKHITTAFCEDDNIDTDDGYRGNMQFVFSLQDSLKGDYIAEHGGGSYPITGNPYAKPKIANATYISYRQNIKGHLITFMDNSGGAYYNSIFMDNLYGVYLEYINGSICSYSQWEMGNLELNNNIFYNIAQNTDTSIMVISGEIANQNKINAWTNYFYQSNNSISDPGIYKEKYINPIPTNDVSQNLAILPDDFEQVNYKGAFSNVNWLNGWTLLSQSGIVK
jgi:hypothetical protein